SDRHLQPLPLRGRARRAGREACARGGVAPALRGDQRVRAPSGARGHGDREALAQHLERGAGQATAATAEGPDQELEVQRGRHRQARELGRLHGRVPRDGGAHLDGLGALVRDPMQPPLGAERRGQRDPRRDARVARDELAGAAGGRPEDEDRVARAGRGRQAVAAFFRRGGKWIGRSSATSAASLTPSLSLGCAAMESPTVSIVASASSAMTPALIRSVASSPTTTRPSSAPVDGWWIVFMKPVRSANMAARAIAEYGNCPVATSSPKRSRAAVSFIPTLATSGSV